MDTTNNNQNDAQTDESNAEDARRERALQIGINEVANRFRREIEKENAVAEYTALIKGA